MIFLSFLLFPSYILHLVNANSDEPECKAFSQLYSSGKELCEKLFDDSFSYSTDLTQSYTMWFFDKTNPNDEITLNRGLSTTDQCLLNYYHKQNVSQEADNFTECHPWKDKSCCFYDTVKDVDTLINAYGDEYRWDRCGPLSQACERFFVQEACFYECDPNVGLYRYQGNHSWKIHQMPIKSDYCDAWYRACYNDLFCAEDDGSFFSCAKKYKSLDNDTTIIYEEVEDKKMETNLVIIIVIVVLIVVLLIGFILYVRHKEKKGQPLFVPLNEAVPPSSPRSVDSDGNDQTR